jgi:hypothetical protein
MSCQWDGIFSVQHDNAAGEQHLLKQKHLKNIKKYALLCLFYSLSCSASALVWGLMKLLPQLLYQFQNYFGLGLLGP